MITTILFDLDNTLIDRQHSIRETFKELIQFDHGVFDATILDDLMLWDHYGYHDKAYVFEHYTQKYSTHFENKQAFHSFIVNHQFRHVTLFEGNERTLRELAQRYTLGIITNGNSIGQRRKMDQALHGLQDLFEVVLVSGDRNIHKPDRRIFKEALDILDKRPEEVMYVGDNIEADIYGSRNAGLTPVWINPYQFESSVDAMTIHSLSELTLLLDK